MRFPNPPLEVDVPRARTPDGVDRRRLRRLGAVGTSLSALIATSIVAGPATASEASLSCALGRTGAHHSEGVDTWNGAYPRPDHALDAVMVFLSFPDSRPLTDPGTLGKDYFPSTARFFDQASYGRFRLRPHIHRRWVRMPHRSGRYGIQRDWDSGRRASYLRDAVAAADASVDFSRYEMVYFVADPDAPGVDSDATKVVNLDQPMRADNAELRRFVTVFEQSPPDRNVLAHETGHVFDLPDLYHRPDDGKGDWDTYVGDWDLMGSQFGLAPDPFAWHKWKLGWLGDNQVDCAGLTGSSVHTLRPLSAPREQGDERRARLLVVRTGPASALAIEARGAVGNDHSLCTEGVLVYRVRSETSSGSGPVRVLDGHPGTAACWGSSVYPPLADAPLGVGESLDAAEDGVRVQVEGRTADGDWTVKVGRD
ncbi:M6 family metalloprotease domain-containing protein [Streptomyces piniterrae]|uniref:M6 family metalloprotease domain-containing protein n=1 Tax=Streptomyces piniterrae TaxID=2571125 RepID=A0A4U0NNH5_9ACTN|nr:M6 family metalloprotease domain-containing protein [Streptomyces piniterrae]TJZ55957.1 M6 family metalloprotease domain-containing protein [Streptomyces piniterrae]